MPEHPTNHVQISGRSIEVRARRPPERVNTSHLIAAFDLQTVEVKIDDHPNVLSGELLPIIAF